jgi:ribosomal protein S18 acetylase RimI-like enzyme
VLIREFSLHDYAAVYALWQNAGGGVTLRPSDERAEIEKKLSRDPDLFLVAESDSQVVGVIMGAWDGRRGWLHHLAVHPNYRQQGVASALLDEVERRLTAKGCLKVNLLVHRDNTVARRLYAQRGYQEMTPFVVMGKEL